MAIPVIAALKVVGFFLLDKVASSIWDFFVMPKEEELSLSEQYLNSVNFNQAISPERLNLEEADKYGKKFLKLSKEENKDPDTLRSILKGLDDASGLDYSSMFDGSEESIKAISDVLKNDLKEMEHLRDYHTSKALEDASYEQMFKLGAVEAFKDFNDRYKKATGRDADFTLDENGFPSILVNDMADKSAELDIISNPSEHALYNQIRELFNEIQHCDKLAEYIKIAGENEKIMDDAIEKNKPVNLQNLYDEYNKTKYTDETFGDNTNANAAQKKIKDRINFFERYYGVSGSTNEVAPTGDWKQPFLGNEDLGMFDFGFCSEKFDELREMIEGIAQDVSAIANRENENSPISYSDGDVSNENVANSFWNMLPDGRDMSPLSLVDGTGDFSQVNVTNSFFNISADRLEFSPVSFTDMPDNVSHENGNTFFNTLSGGSESSPASLADKTGDFSQVNVTNSFFNVSADRLEFSPVSFTDMPDNVSHENGNTFFNTFLGGSEMSPTSLTITSGDISHGNIANSFWNMLPGGSEMSPALADGTGNFSQMNVTNSFFNVSGDRVEVSPVSFGDGIIDNSNNDNSSQNFSNHDEANSNAYSNVSNFDNFGIFNGMSKSLFGVIENIKTAIGSYSNEVGRENPSFSDYFNERGKNLSSENSVSNREKTENSSFVSLNDYYRDMTESALALSEYSQNTMSEIEKIREAIEAKQQTINNFNGNFDIKMASPSNDVSVNEVKDNFENEFNSLGSQLKEHAALDT